jgi:hypothetical protein
MSLVRCLDRWRDAPLPISQWRRHARFAMRDAIRDLLKSRAPLDEASILAVVDAAYPFGERARHPYKAWLQERVLLREYLAGGPRSKIEGPTAEDAAACEVAVDLVELGRVDEAKALLAQQAPRRLNRVCQACGAEVGKPCREQREEIVVDNGLHYDKRTGRIRDHIPLSRVIKKWVELDVPHLARVTVTNGPLFGGLP